MDSYVIFKINKNTYFTFYSFYFTAKSILFIYLFILPDYIL